MKIRVVQRDGLVKEAVFTEDGLVREMYKGNGETFTYTKFSSDGVETKTVMTKNMPDGPKKYLLSGASESFVSTSYPRQEVEFEIWDRVGIDYRTNRPIYRERNTGEVSTYRNKTQQKKVRESRKLLIQAETA